MTQKNIFVYRLFLLNISDFSLIFIQKLQPATPEKCHPTLSQQLFENLVRDSTPSPIRKGRFALCLYPSSPSQGRFCWAIEEKSTHTMRIV